MAWVGAVLIGVSLGLLGSGGSILTVPVLIYLAGEPEKLAIAESLAIVGLIAASGAVRRSLRGLVDWKTVAIFGVPGMAGAYLGAWVAGFVSASFQLMAFALIMLLAAVLMARGTDRLGDSHEERRVGRIALDGLVVGAVTGLVGVGGGFLIVPALVLLGGLTMHLAIGTSLAIIALKSIVGFAKYWHDLEASGQSMNWLLIAVFAALGFLGTLVGGSVADRLPKQQLERGFAAFLVIMGVFILWQYAPAVFGATG